MRKRTSTDSAVCILKHAVCTERNGRVKAKRNRLKKVNVNVGLRGTGVRSRKRGHDILRGTKNPFSHQIIDLRLGWSTPCKM